MTLFRGGRPAFVHAYERAVANTRASWRETELLALDFEATGLDLARDDVISFGAVPIRDGRVMAGGQRYSLLKPTKPIPPTSSIVHRIRNQDLALARDAADVAEELIGLLAGRVLVAHAAWVEVAFLKRLLSLHNARLLAPVVDTAALARALDLVPRIAHREPDLESLAGTLGVPVHDPHHALGDALTTAQVFLVLASRLERQQRSGVLDVATLVNLTNQYALLRP